MAHNPLANAISFTAPISQGGITNYTVEAPGNIKEVALSADRNLELRPGNSNSPPPNGSESKILNNPNSI
jgi:hypothetical protein